MLSSFKDLLENPAQNLERLAKLLKILSGKEDDTRNAKKMAEFLTKRIEGSQEEHGNYIRILAHGLFEIVQSVLGGEEVNASFLSFFCDSLFCIARTITNCPPAFRQFDIEVRKIFKEEEIQEGSEDFLFILMAGLNIVALLPDKSA